MPIVIDRKSSQTVASLTKQTWTEKRNFSGNMMRVCDRITVMHRRWIDRWHICMKHEWINKRKSQLRICVLFLQSTYGSLRKVRPGWQQPDVVERTLTTYRYKDKIQLKIEVKNKVKVLTDKLHLTLLLICGNLILLQTLLAKIHRWSILRRPLEFQL